MEISRQLLLTCACAGALAVWAPAGARGQGAPQSFFVATDGSDRNPGTQAQPFASLQRARDAIRELTGTGASPAGGVTVWVADGTYWLPESLTLKRGDGGTQESPIVYRAAHKGRAHLCGGRAIPSHAFEPVHSADVLRRLDVSARGQVVRTDLKALGITDYLPELPANFKGGKVILLEVFCNGERMTLARWPNQGFAQWEEIVDFGSGLRDPSGKKRPGKFRYAGDRPKRWATADGVWLLGYWARAYASHFLKVATIDTVDRVIEFAEPYYYGLDTAGAKRYFALNLLEELDAPGEWYLDRKTGVLYFWPPCSLSEARIVVSVLTDPVVSLRGVAHVTLHGFAIEYGRSDAVRIAGGEQNGVVGCTLRNVGGNGVVVSGGRGHGVSGCDIHHVGKRGITLIGGDRKTLTPGEHSAVNNHIHHTSRFLRTHAGAVSLEGVGNRAAHNLIHHDPHTPVWFRGNDHVMEYNEIYQTNLETSEAGVFYTGRDWTYRGNVIRYNFIHHIPDGVAGGGSSTRVAHLDDCVSGTSFVSNICYRTGGVVSICGGPENVAENCIFVDCKLGVDLSDRGLKWWTWHRRADGSVYAIDARTGKEGCALLASLERVPYNQAPYTKYPHLADMLDRDPVSAPWYCSITRNIAVGGQLLVTSRGVKQEWVRIEDNWDAAEKGDPGFVSLGPRDYRLKPDAPVLKLGFKPIPFEQIGLINDETRASWPVQAEPPPTGWKPRWMHQREQEERMPSGLPVFEVKRAAATIAIDGVATAAEWTPANGPAHELACLDSAVNGRKVDYPSRAWLEADDAHLYVAFVNDVDPAKGVTRGQQWGMDDAVEVALAQVTGTEVGDIMVLRGYTNGHFESSGEAGAPQPVVARVAQGVEYAAGTDGPGQWTAEWKIPFAALGVEPAKRNPRLLFNLSVRQMAGKRWVTWTKERSHTWDVRRGGVLWLAPFGDVVFNGALPSQARIDIDGRAGDVAMTAVKGCQRAAWAKLSGTRLIGSTDDLTAGIWRDFEYAFTAEKDGPVSFALLGRVLPSAIDGRLIPVWVYFDDIVVEGAALVNGSFEQLDANGRPVGWQNALEKAFVVSDARAACTGTRCVKVWHRGRFGQTLQVKAGQQVTIRAKVKGERAQ